ncbi:hypothetical protein AMATHDRAFT_105190, partial [Amanita thiersii Skay4041]
PVKWLKSHLISIFTSWTIPLPIDSPCILTATKNIVRWQINNVPELKVCPKAACAETTLGEF